jgi:helicase
MPFRGLFVGVDRYHSPAINWLTCAKRDAVALHAIFADNLGVGGQLLTDDSATRAAIESAFVDLAACSPDDFVVVAFSGHGSQTHELVTFDAELNRLKETCIPLDELTQWFSRIPARRMVCIIDCCFSGGMGAKVLHVDAIPRDLKSEDAFLDSFSGNGRFILTATTAHQPAWEVQSTGHGLLTHFFLEALQGAAEVVEGGRIPLYRLFEHVTRRVASSASVFGKVQQPTFRGQLDGENFWPIFHLGEAYRRAFPDSTTEPVTEDIASLAVHGFPPELTTCWAESIPSLNALQLAAINDYGVLSGDHVVISAPTSSGKTMIGELGALSGTLKRRRAVFLLPLKALVNDKYRHFTRTYGDYGLRIIRATGDVAE